MPVMQPRRPKAYHNVSGELTTAPGIATVTVTPEGDITVKKIKRRIFLQKKNLQSKIQQIKKL